MNSDQVEGKWKQFAGSFREKFGKFTNDDVALMNGKAEQVVGKIQEKYGDSKEDAERRYHEWVSSLRDDQKARASGGTHNL
jgi:uncharacterized protein YjbJ (UPF0337 family)